MNINNENLNSIGPGRRDYDRMPTMQPWIWIVIVALVLIAIAYAFRSREVPVSNTAITPDSKITAPADNASSTTPSLPGQIVRNTASPSSTTGDAISRQSSTARAPDNPEPTANTGAAANTSTGVNPNNGDR